MYVSICVHSNPYYVASCSPRPSFSATMTDAGTHALLKKWADAVALRTVHTGVYSPDSTRTVSWPSLENRAWSTLDTPVALVKLTHPGVAQPHSLAPLLGGDMRMHTAVVAMYILLGDMYGTMFEEGALQAPEVAQAF